MFTTGFKFFFGMGVALITAAVVYGYTTGGNHMGPLSMGWKGGVGDHLGYSLLLALGVMSATVGLVLVAFRDADPAAQAHYVGVDQLATNPPVTGSFWPVVGAFGAGTMAVGLVLHTAVFVVGLVIVGVVAIEWLMDAWSDRATGDPEANKALRDRIMAPIEIPAFGAAAAAVGVLAVSRILLAVSKTGAVVVAGVVSVLIVGLGVLFALRPRMSRNLASGLALLLGLGVLGGGIAAAVTGEREFEEHEVHLDDGADTHDEADTQDGADVHDSGSTDHSDEGQQGE